MQLLRVGPNFQQNKQTNKYKIPKQQTSKTNNPKKQRLRTCQCAIYRSVWLHIPELFFVCFGFACLNISTFGNFILFGTVQRLDFWIVEVGLGIGVGVGVKSSGVEQSRVEESRV